MSRRNTPLSVIGRIVEATPEIDNASCWPWPGALDGKGYGLVGYHGRTRRVHRLVYELLVGSIPEGLTLDHLCRNRRCANPNHLQPVTSVENVRRSDIAPSQINRRKTHCIRHHPLSGDNVRMVKGGRYRQCRVCTKAAQHRRYVERRASA